MSVDETTPLLPAAGNGAENAFPSILSAVQRLPPEPSLSDLLATHSGSQTSPLLADAFHLLLVLHLLVAEKGDGLSPSRQESTLDAWYELQKRGRSQRNLRLLAGELLEHMANNEPILQNVHLEGILLAAFNVDSSKSRMIRGLFSRILIMNDG
jgi:hypothetical protein